MVLNVHLYIKYLSLFYAFLSFNKEKQIAFRECIEKSKYLIQWLEWLT